MPSKKVPCPTCGQPKAAKSVQCRHCKPTYERTAEHRQRMSDSHKGRQPRGTGWRHHPKTRAKIRAAWTDEKREAARQRGKAKAADADWLLRIARSLTGPRNPRWEGGISGQPYPPGFSKTLKARIRRRDGYRCQLCAATESELGYRLSIHHADYEKENLDESNLFAVCKRCNSLVNTNRTVWVGYFVALADMRRKLGQDVDRLIDRKVITQREGFASVQVNGGPDLRPLFELA